MEGIKDKVAIIGMGCTKFGELWDKSVGDLMVEAAYEAFEDAGIEQKQVDAAWIGTVFSGLSAITLAPLRLSYIPITRVENMCATGSEALRAAAYAVAAGACDIALALGVEKLKDAGTTGLAGPAVVGSSTLGTSGVAPGYSPPAAFAYLGTRYFHHHGIKPEDGKRLLAKIAVKNHHNGSLNPKAHFQNEITEEQVIKAPIVAWPLGLLDCCGVSDGAAAAIVVRADMAKNFRPDPIYVKAIQIAADSGATPRTFTSSYNASVKFQFAPYVGNNAVYLDGPGSVTLSLANPSKFQSHTVGEDMQRSMRRTPLDVMTGLGAANRGIDRVPTFSK